MPAKITTDLYIEKAKQLHGDVYDYSLVEYSTAACNIDIVCRKHGVFSIKASSHLQGSGCQKCSGKFRYNNETFAEAARLVHGDEFDYSRVEYKNNKTPVKITCKNGHTTLVVPGNHLSGTKCSKCNGTARLTTAEFIESSIVVHGNKYDYSLVEYKASYSKVKIICPVHGVFEQTPASHKSGQGCPHCAGITKNTASFIEQANKVHSGKYAYTKSIYVQNKQKLTITCKEHGDFQQSPNSHLRGSGCPHCAGAVRHTTQSFIEKAKIRHGDKYDYSLVEYGKNNTSPVTIICKEHGEFQQRPIDHLEGNGCQKCGILFGGAENDVREFVESLGFSTVKDKSILDGKEIDIYISEKKLGIEYNGLYWHSDAVLLDPINAHKRKTDVAQSKGVRLLHLFEDDWLLNRTVVEKYIKVALGIIDRRIFARNCTTSKISSKQAREFLDDNHLQGGSNSELNLGLFYYDELVAVMQFSQNTSNRGKINKGLYELTRYATCCSVVGGASKLFSYFRKNFEFTEIFSFSDNSWFSGGMYEKLGFVKKYELPPDYKVIDGNMRKHKSMFKRSNLEKRFGDKFNKDLSERENCNKLGLYRVYDCGKIKWSYKEP